MSPRFVKFNSEVKKAVWNDEEGIYNVEIQRSDGSIIKDWCHTLINCTGILNKWKCKYLPIQLCPSIWVLTLHRAENPGLDLVSRNSVTFSCLGSLSRLHRQASCGHWHWQLWDTDHTPSAEESVSATAVPFRLANIIQKQKLSASSRGHRIGLLPSLEAWLRLKSPPVPITQRSQSYFSEAKSPSRFQKKRRKLSGRIQTSYLHLEEH